MGVIYGEIRDERDDFSIECLREQESNNMPAIHCHEHYEIYYQLSGERIYFIEDRVYRVHAGDLVLVNIRDLHKTMSAGTPRFGRVLLAFSRNFLRDMTAGVRDADLFGCFQLPGKVIVLTLPQQSAAEHILFEMIDESRRQETGYQTGLKLDVMRLLLFISRHAGREEESPPGSGAAVRPIHDKITLAAQYINNHYAQELSLRSIADRFHISYYYFCRVFREVTGFTLTEYVNSVRIKHAQQLLKETRRSVTEIAGLVGYDSCTNFERVFKSLTHVPPLQYRRQSGW